MEYTFYINEGGYPEFGVEKEYWQLWELASCEEDYLSEIVVELEKVLNGKSEGYDFGYEVYIIDCKKDNCQVQNTFEDWRIEATIPTKDVYKLLKDWQAYLTEWNNKKSQAQ